MPTEITMKDMDEMENLLQGLQLNPLTRVELKDLRHGLEQRLGKRAERPAASQGLRKLTYRQRCAAAAAIAIAVGLACGAIMWRKHSDAASARHVKPSGEKDLGGSVSRGLMASADLVPELVGEGGRRQPDMPMVKPGGDSAPQAKAAPQRFHIVEKGENLSRIAQHYYGSTRFWREILDANPGVDPNRLRVKQKIVLPRKPTESVG